MHIFFSEDVTAANNTVYNQYLDPYNVGAARAGIDTNQSYSDTIINNLVVAIPLAPGTRGCAFGEKPYAQFNSAMIGGGIAGEPADVFSQQHHRSCRAATIPAGRHFGQDSPTGENPMFNADTYSCTANLCATNPGVGRCRDQFRRAARRSNPTAQISRCKPTAPRSATASPNPGCPRNRWMPARARAR